MEFPIYTYGGGDVLWKVYSGISMLFASSNPFLTNAWTISLAFGGIWAMVSAIFSSQIGVFLRDYLLPSFLLMNLLFLPKTSVHIIDKVDHHFEYVKVDHVPLGVAAIPSLLSMISFGLTESIETVMAPVDAQKYGKSGLMFGARLVHQASEVRVADPLMRENMKGFMSRCYLWPYIYTNCKGLKNEAKTTKDILGFLEANPHSWLGTYWKNPDGSQEFRTCRACLPEVRAVLEAETRAGITRLAKNLFSWDAGKDPDGSINTRHLERYFNDGWATLMGEARSSHQTIGQYILLNAYREARDDHREKVGLQRLYPKLVGMQGARVQSEQNMAGLISGNISSSWLPTLQVIFFAILLATFPFVIVMTFLPGGVKNLQMWVQLVVWIQMWPVFHAILNCIGLMYLEHALSGQYLNFGGLNVLSQYALQDQAYNAYAWIQSFLMSVPLLSWAMVSASGYALTSLASSAASSMAGYASRAASESVTGNTSFDNITAHTRSVGNQTMGQSNIGNSFDFGRKVDTGSMKLTDDRTYGELHAENRQSSLGFEVSATRAYSNSLGHQVTESQQATKTAEQGYNESLSVYGEKTAHLAEAISQGKAFDSSLSAEQRLDQQHSMEKVRDAMDKISQDKSFVDQTQTTIGLSGGASGSIGLNFANLFASKNGKGIKPPASVGASGEIKGGISIDGNSTAQQNDISQKLKENGITDRDMLNVSNAFQSARSESFRTNNDSTKTLTEDYREAFNKTKAAHESLSVAKSQELRDQETFDYVRNNETRLSRPLGNHLLHKVASDKFGGNEVQAAEWIKANISTASNWSEPYLKDFRPGDIARGDVQGQAQEWTREVQNKRGALETGKTEGMDTLKRNNSDLRSEVKDKISRGKDKVEGLFNLKSVTFDLVEKSVKDGLSARGSNMQEKYLKKAGEGNVMRAVRNMNPWKK